MHTPSTLLVTHFRKIKKYFIRKKIVISYYIFTIYLERLKNGKSLLFSGRAILQRNEIDYTNEKKKTKNTLRTYKNYLKPVKYFTKLHR